MREVILEAAEIQKSLHQLSIHSKYLPGGQTVSCSKGSHFHKAFLPRPDKYTCTLHAFPTH